MKKALLLHNPNAGEETHEEAELIALLADSGFQTRYRSLKAPFWKKDIADEDLLIVAGGDGSVRKVAKALLKKKGEKLPPVAVLPLGTANNISRTITGHQDIDTILKNWQGRVIKPFDVGWIKGLEKKHFFIEAFGFGVFPGLVSAMKIIDRALRDEPAKRMDTALGLLAGIIRSYKPKPCTLEVDGKDYSGNYLLVEIMNVCSIGPNLSLASTCDPGDGRFHIVAVAEGGRDLLLDFVAQRIKGEEPPAGLQPIIGRLIRLSTAERKLHIDDKLVKTAGSPELTITADKHRLSFLG